MGNDDFVRVPKKATEHMVEQARMTLPGPVDICDADIEDIYETMLSAAPPSAPSGDNVSTPSGLEEPSAAAAGKSREDKLIEAWNADRQRFFEARDALYQFKYPPDPKLLREIADEIDCGNDCAHGYTEWDSNAHVCSRSDSKEGCASEKASCLRQFADAIDVRSRLQPAAASEAPISAEAVKSPDVAEMVERLKQRFDDKFWPGLPTVRKDYEDAASLLQSLARERDHLKAALLDMTQVREMLKDRVEFAVEWIDGLSEATPVGSEDRDAALKTLHSAQIQRGR